MQSISSPDFQLEPLVVGHAEALFPVLSEAALYDHLDFDPPSTLEHLQGVFQRREARVSPDGTQQWLNWAIRLPSGELAGYVQATIFLPGSTWVAYMLSTKYWGKGIGRSATAAMIEHLSSSYSCQTFLATVERLNSRSVALLRALSFSQACTTERAKHELTSTEDLYVLHTRDRSAV